MMSSSRSNRTKVNNNQRTRRQSLSSTNKNLKSSNNSYINLIAKKSINNTINTSYNINTSDRTNNRMDENRNFKFTKPASYGLFNYLQSPFYAKKLNDPSSRKYKQKLARRQQYWGNQNNYNRYNRQLPVLPTGFFNCKYH